MKVALCLSGQTLTFDKCWPTMKKYLVEPLNADVFCNVCNDKDIYKIIPFIKDFTYLTITSDIELFIPFEFRQFVNDSIINQKILQQLLYVHRCNENKREMEGLLHKRYDVVIRSRMDLFFESGIETNIKSGIYFPIFGNEGGFSDRFAFGPSNLMDIYSVRINSLKKSAALIWNPEQELKVFIEENTKIPHFRSNVLFYRLKEKDGMYHTMLSDVVIDVDSYDKGICGNFKFLKNLDKIEQIKKANHIIEVDI